MRAIFLGTFNPPHNGHVNCIKSVIRSGILNQLNIKRIHIIPCWQNPNKEEFDDPEKRFWQRYKMCSLEFSGLNEFCFIDDIELGMKFKYTYEVIEYFKSGEDPFFTDGDFWWIITAETFKELIDKKWYNSEKLINENKFIILIPDDLTNTEYNEIIKYTNDDSRYQLIDLINDPMATMHSTKLREMIENNENVYPYINLGTQLYIKQNYIYHSKSNSRST